MTTLKSNGSQIKDYNLITKMKFELPGLKSNNRKKQSLVESYGWHELMLSVD